MRVKVLLVDDEVQAVNRLKLHLEKHAEIENLSTCFGGKEALRLIDLEKPDIVFIDIEMPGMNGIEVLKACEKPYPYFIFVTAYNEYAVNAFEQNALDYILKPYTPGRVEDAFNKAMEMLEKDALAEHAENYKNLLFGLAEKMELQTVDRYIERIAVKSIGKTIFVKVSEIIYIQAADQYVEIITEMGKFTARESMDQLEKKLNPKYFFRTHRSFIVSLNQVVGLENVDKHISWVLLKNGTKLKITNTRKADFKQRMKI
ncbi:MAG: LytTR family DNA-binding domain-containing protein [Bacteroidota bacterium]